MSVEANSRVGFRRSCKEIACCEKNQSISRLRYIPQRVFLLFYYLSAQAYQRFALSFKGKAVISIDQSRMIPNKGRIVLCFCPPAELGSELFDQLNKVNRCRFFGELTL